MPPVRLVRGRPAACAFPSLGEADTEVGDALAGRGLASQARHVRAAGEPSGDPRENCPPCPPDPSMAFMCCLLRSHQVRFTSHCSLVSL